MEFAAHGGQAINYQELHLARPGLIDKVIGPERIPSTCAGPAGGLGRAPVTGPVDGWGDEWDHVADVVVGSGVAGMMRRPRRAAVASGRRPGRGSSRGYHCQVGRRARIPNNPFLPERGLTDAPARCGLARTTCRPSTTPSTPPGSP
jgi:hypothetical protein